MFIQMPMSKKRRKRQKKFTLCLKGQKADTPQTSMGPTFTQGRVMAEFNQDQTFR